MSYLFDMKNDESFVWNAYRIRAQRSMMHLNIVQYIFLFLSLSIFAISCSSPHIYGLEFIISWCETFCTILDLIASELLMWLHLMPIISQRNFHDDFFFCRIVLTKYTRKSSHQLCAAITIGFKSSLSWTQNDHFFWSVSISKWNVIQFHINLMNI